MARGSIGDLFGNLLNPKYLVTLGFVVVVGLLIINDFTQGKLGEGVSLSSVAYLTSVAGLVAVPTSLTLRGMLTGNFDIAYKELLVVLLVSAGFVFIIYIVGKDTDIGIFSFASQEVGRMALG